MDSSQKRLSLVGLDFEVNVVSDLGYFIALGAPAALDCDDTGC